MKITGFRADADIVGRRLRVTWAFEPEGGESADPIPPVALYRKTHDFEFPADASLGRFLLVGSGSSGAVEPAALVPAALVPAGLEPRSLPSRESRDGAVRTVIRAVSLPRQWEGRLIEVMRCTVATTTTLDGAFVGQRIEIVDGDNRGEIPFLGLTPGLVYYYQLVVQGQADPYRATAAPTDYYGLNRRLYEMLPGVYTRRDTSSRPETPGTEAVPEAAPRSGQLRRFLDMFGAALDHLRGSAEGLRGLHDIRNVDYRYLPLLAQWIGWDLSQDVGIPLQRNEIRSAAALYRTVGTAPAIQAIVDRYTGWHTHIEERAQSIALSNAPPQLQVFAMEEGADGWRGINDAARALGFAPPHDAAAAPTSFLAPGAGGAAMASLQAPGAGGQVPASLASARSATFPLRPGMELWVAADNNPAAGVRFGPGDFETISRATGREVAAAVGRALSQVTAAPSGDGLGFILSSNVRGTDSSIKVMPLPPSLVTLEGAPRGRLSAAVDGRSRLLLFYEAFDPRASAPASGGPAAGQIRYKVFASGTWGSSQPLVAGPLAADPLAGSPLAAQGSPLAAQGSPLAAQGSPLAAQGSPAAIALDGGGRAWVAWIARAGTGSAYVLSMRQAADPPPATADHPHCIAWEGAPVPVAATAPGRIDDLHAQLDGVGGLRLFWAAHDGACWRIMASRGDGQSWSTLEALSDAATDSREPCAVLDRSSGRLWLVWSQRDAARVHEDVWQLFCRTLEPGADGQGLDWSDPKPLTAPPKDGRAADREPSAVVMPDGTLRVFFRSDRGGGRKVWSVAVPPDGAGGRAVAEPAAMTFGAQSDSAPFPVLVPDAVAAGSDGGAIPEAAAPPASAGPADPAASGSATGPADPAASSTAMGPADRPASGTPAQTAPARLWLFFRSDRSVPFAQLDGALSVAAGPPAAGITSGGSSLTVPTPGGVTAGMATPLPSPAGVAPMSLVDPNRPAAPASARIPDDATVRRFAGTTAVAPADRERLALRRQWGDLLAYSPQQLGPGTPDPEVDLYARGTIGLYVSQGNSRTPMTQANVSRLRQLLDRFLPINTRVAIFWTPADTEVVYPPGGGVQDSYFESHAEDRYTETLASPVEDRGEVRLDSRPFVSNVKADRTVLWKADSGTGGAIAGTDPDTVRSRTYSPPPE